MSGSSSSELPDGSTFVGNSGDVKGWELISTILGSAFVFVGAKLAGAAETIVQLHVWAITAIGQAWASGIGALFGGGAYVTETAWAGAFMQSQAAGVLAPWLIVLDLIIVLTIVFIARKWGSIP